MIHRPLNLLHVTDRTCPYLASETGPEATGTVLILRGGPPLKDDGGRAATVLRYLGCLTLCFAGPYVYGLPCAPSPVKGGKITPSLGLVEAVGYYGPPPPYRLRRAESNRRPATYEAAMLPLHHSASMTYN